MGEPLVSVLAFRAMLEAFSRLGLDRRRIEQEAGVHRADLSHPDRLLPAARLYGMWEVAGGLWNRPGLGLSTGRAVPFGAYEVLDYLLLSASTLGQGLADFFSYFPVATHTARYDLHQERELVSCEMVWLIPPSGVMFHLRDYSLSTVAFRAREASGCGPVHVEIDGPPLAPAGDYDEAFGATTALHAGRNALVFSSQAWNAPMPRRDEHLRRTLRRHADHLLAGSVAALTANIGERVRAELLRRAKVGLPPIEEVARALGLGARTLQRQLRQEGVNYADLAEKVRANLAIEYLRDRNLTIGEVAYLLGFSAPSAFSRAFKRWSGKTPQEFRQ